MGGDVSKSRVVPNSILMITTILACIVSAGTDAYAQPQLVYSSFTTPDQCGATCSKDNPIDDCVNDCLIQASVQTLVPLQIYLPPKIEFAGPKAQPRGVPYEVDPVTVKRPLIIHGPNSTTTLLKSKDKTNNAPLFTVESSVFQLTGIGIEAPDPTTPNPPGGYNCCTAPGPGLEACDLAGGVTYPCICCRSANDKSPNGACNKSREDHTAIHVPPSLSPVPVQLVLSGTRMFESRVLVERAGNYRLQGAWFKPNGHVDAPIVIDHPDADLEMIGGGSLHLPFQILPYESLAGPFHHIIQKRGRVQVYGALFNAVFGNADIRIESAAANGAPHVVAAVRSEGINEQEVPFFGALVYVPPTDQAVNVLMKANDAGWGGPGFCRTTTIEANGHLIDYNGKGTVWLLQNGGPRSLGALAVGDAPDSTIVAIGNDSYTSSILPITSSNKIFFGNVYNYRDAADCTLGDLCCAPYTRLVNPTKTAQDYASIPEPPTVSIPDPILRPLVDERMPGMFDVTQPPFNADPSAGAGQDDTAALQAALNAAMRGGDCDGSGTSSCYGGVYFPAGSYEITSPLKWYHQDQGADFLLGRDSNGNQINTLRPLGRTFIAGEGPATTTIENTQGGTVFEASFLSDSTLKDLTFKTADYVPAAPGVAETVIAPNVQVDYHRAFLADPDGNGGPNALQGSSTANVFESCVFEGGKFGLAVALESQINNEGFLMVNSKFKKTKFGYANGGQNALGNIIYDPLATPQNPTFEDNQFTMGSPDDFCLYDSPCNSPLPLACEKHRGDVDGDGVIEAEEWLDKNGDGMIEVSEGDYDGDETLDNDDVITYGGSWHVFGATVRNTAVQEMPYISPRPLYFWGLDTDTEVLHNRDFLGKASASFGLFFDQATLSSDGTEPLLGLFTGWGAFFLNSDTNPLGYTPPQIEIGIDFSATAVFNLGDTTLWQSQFDMSCLGGAPKPQFAAAFETDLSPVQTCSTSSECASGGSCGAGECVSGLCRYCDDGVPCTIDTCTDLGCSNAAADFRCDDEMLCTGTNSASEMGLDNAWGVCDPSDPSSNSEGCVPQPVRNSECCFGSFETTCGPDCTASSSCNAANTFLMATVDKECAYPGEGEFQESVFLDLCPCEFSDPNAICNLFQQTTNSDCGCSLDDQCQDTLFCNGAETCVGSSCVRPGNPCGAGTTCVEEIDACLTTCPAQQVCKTPDSVTQSQCLGSALNETACGTTYGVVLGCPEGQQLYSSDCDCAGNDTGATASVYCAP